jgi:hypothetical protein
MRQRKWWLGLMAFALLAGPALADRVPTTRTETPRAHGTRPDITVPYLTNGGSNFGVANGVAPLIYSSPVLDDPSKPGTRPVYNLPFYGARMSYGSSSNGAVPKPTLLPSQAK